MQEGFNRKHRRKRPWTGEISNLATCNYLCLDETETADILILLLLPG